MMTENYHLANLNMLLLGLQIFSLLSISGFESLEQFRTTCKFSYDNICLVCPLGRTIPIISPLKMREHPFTINIDKLLSKLSCSSCAFYYVTGHNEKLCTPREY